MTVEICPRCHGAGAPEVYEPACGVCRGSGLYMRESSSIGPNDPPKFIAEVGLCETCGCRSYSGKCTGKSKFHWWQHAATARALQGYATVPEAAVARAKATAQGVDGFTARADYLVEVHVAELEEVQDYLVLVASLEFLAVSQVLAEPCPLWKARIIQKERLIAAGKYEAFTLARDWIEAAHVAGYHRTQQTKAWVYTTPSTTFEVLRSLRWLASAWVQKHPTPYPREEHRTLYVHLLKHGFQDLWDREFLQNMEPES